MKLSIVIICWNDRTVIENCLASIYSGTKDLEFEIIVSDNGSEDDSVLSIRKKFPCVRLVENGQNLGFARGNNAGIREARGEYVLILNPDTIIQDNALGNLIAYADLHPEAGGFGARVENPDGTFQCCARPIPTIRGYLVAALYLRALGRISEKLGGDTYPGWAGIRERDVGFQSGCCVMFRRRVLEELNGFDEQFFYHFEEVDLCYRVWRSGRSIKFYPRSVITHIGGQSVGRAPIRFAIETYRSRYRFFFKHFGVTGLRRIRWVSLLHLALRWTGYRLLAVGRFTDQLAERLKSYRILILWNWQIDPLEFVRTGKEPDSGFTPLAPPPTRAEPMRLDRLNNL